MKRELSFVLAIIISLALLSAQQPLAQGEQAPVTVKAYIKVGEGGNATVTLTFIAHSRVSFTFTLPKFEQYRVCSSYGNYSIRDVPSSAYFYYNSSIMLTPGDNGTALLSVCYDFPYATLLSGNRGWFMSPMLIAYPAYPVEVHVHIPGVSEVTLESPKADRVLGNEDRVYTLSPSKTQVITGRVVIEYTASNIVEVLNFTSRVQNTIVVVEGPKYYKSLAERVASVASRASEELSGVSGVSVPMLYFKLYLPRESMGGINTLGFVMGEDINAGGQGPIMINLALLRYAPGYLETTVIHEMVHTFLGRVGVEANDETRWFHEGLAQYLSIVVAEKTGYNVSEYAEDLLNASQFFFNYVSGNLSFIEKWPSDPYSVSEAYLASFYIVYNITESHGGLKFIKALFNSLKVYGKVKNTKDIVLTLSEAAGENLAPLFRKWGFKNVVDWTPSPRVSPETPSQRSGSGAFSTVVLALGVLIGLLTYVLNARVQRELEVARTKSVFEKSTLLSLSHE